MSFEPTQPFDLPLLPPDDIATDLQINQLLVDARAQLGELKGYSYSLPNPLLLLSPAIIKESLASSEIENINTTLIDVLENQLFSEEERKEPNKEVLRYRDAIMWGFDNLDDYSLSTRLISGIRDTLMPEQPAGYRQQQNAIKDEKRNKIIYTPPIQAKISQYMSNFEDFVNGDSPKELDPLLRAIIGHYQFEAIHPFSDGNGRTGRILMVLGLVQKKLLDFPILYISGYISENKNDYYRHLLAVTTDGNWKSYILFMLKGFLEQAKNTKDYIFRIKNLYYELKDKIRNENSSVYSADLVEILFSTPILSPSKLSELLKCHYTTASKYLKALEKMGILVHKKVGRYQLYANSRLIKLLHN